MNKSNSDSLAQRSPWMRPWPKENIEDVAFCPVCDSFDRSILFFDVIDNTFFTAAGRWTLFKCSSCGTSYLNPRPTSDSIVKAYEAYYTHKDGEGQRDSAKLSLLRRLRRMFANGYVNQRFGTTRFPAIKIHSWVANLLPTKSVMDSQFRYLPKPIQGQRLLDIGCGNGDFLINAKEMGWKASGLEPDTTAVEVARGRGFDVFDGTIDALADRFNYYDAITISHVIEHVYQPRDFLRTVNQILKNNGVIYIDTPNIQSYGAKIFGKYWRGIESPRHLTLFNPSSLKNLLLSCGFHDIVFLRRTDVQRGMYLSSKKISELGLPIQTKKPYPEIWGKYLMNYPFIKTEHLEFITLIARKKTP